MPMCDTEVKPIAPPPPSSTHGILYVEPDGTSIQEQISNAGRGLFGRDDEKNLIAGEIQNYVERKEGGLVVIKGGVGTGKSALVNYATSVASGAGLRCLTICGEQNEKESMLFVLHQLFFSLTDPNDMEKQQEILQSIMGDFTQDEEWKASVLYPSISVVLRLSVQLSSESVKNPTSTLLARASALQQTQTGVIKHLIERVNESVDVLIVEDCHWYDLKSLPALSTLIKSFVKTKLVFVSFRSDVGIEMLDGAGAVSAQQIFKELMEDLASLQTLAKSNLTMGTLSREACAAVLQMHTGTHPPEEMVTRVMQISNGNAFWITQLAQSTAAGDDKEDPIASAESSATLHGCLIHKFKQLPQQQQDLLMIGSLVGRTFEERMLHRILPLSFRRKFKLPQEIKALTENNFIHSIENAPITTMRFVHDLVRETVMDQIPDSKRTKWHKQIAECYEKFYEDDLRPYFMVLVNHFSKCGYMEETFTYLKLAAFATLQLDLIDKSVDLLKRATAIIQSDHVPAKRLENIEQLRMMLNRSLLDTGLPKEMLSKTAIGESVSEFKGMEELSLRKYHKIFLVLVYLNNMKMALEEDPATDIDSLFAGCATLSEDVITDGNATVETEPGSEQAQDTITGEGDPNAPLDMEGKSAVCQIL